MERSVDLGCWSKQNRHGWSIWRWRQKKAMLEETGFARESTRPTDRADLSQFKTELVAISKQQGASIDAMARGYGTNSRRQGPPSEDLRCLRLSLTSIVATPVLLVSLCRTLQWLELSN
jgi:hypothetical protein